MKRVLLALALAGALAGCGYKVEETRLLPPDPALSRAQLKEARAAERAKIESGLAVSPAARPQRVDDLTVRLDIRKDDPFALPPPGTPGGVSPFPGEPAGREDR